MPDVFSEYEKVSWEWLSNELDEDEAAKKLIINYINKWIFIEPKTVHYINKDCNKRDVHVLASRNSIWYKISRVTYTGLDLLWWISLLKGIMLKGKSLKELILNSETNEKGICFEIFHYFKRKLGKEIGRIEDCYGNIGLEGIIKKAKETISIRSEKRKINKESKILNKRKRIYSKSLKRFAEEDEDFFSQIDISNMFKELSPTPKIVKGPKRNRKIPLNLDTSELSLIFSDVSLKAKTNPFKDSDFSIGEPSLSWRPTTLSRSIFSNH